MTSGTDMRGRRAGPARRPAYGSAQISVDVSAEIFAPSSGAASAALPGPGCDDTASPRSRTSGFLCCLLTVDERRRRNSCSERNPPWRRPRFALMSWSSATARYRATQPTSLVTLWALRSRQGPDPADSSSPTGSLDVPIEPIVVLARNRTSSNRRVPRAANISTVTARTLRGKLSRG
jgi:hypothetical protein